VRVQARHTSRTRVDAELEGTLLQLDVDADRGPASADFQLTVPPWIGLQLDGRACFVDVEGVEGPLSVETVEGDVLLRGVAGLVTAESIDGNITLEGGRARAQLSTVDGAIAVVKAGGEVIAESVNGNISITDAQVSAVELSTVDGDIAYAGPLQPAGRYLFVTHDGNVLLTLPPATGATFAVRTFGDGRIESTMPLKQTSAGRRGQRATYVLGNGAAQVDIEAFDGAVRIRQP
jgi:DUF4097 and DUF4098 domain-containing protein YvlB